jgi:hypothetical protein
MRRGNRQGIKIHRIGLELTLEEFSKNPVEAAVTLTFGVGRLGWGLW